MATATTEKPKTPDLLDSGPTESQALAPTTGADVVQMFERLARDPSASVEKIERLMALWERNDERRAASEFNVAMSAAQKKMRPVATDASNPQTHSRYASYEALDRVLRPIYTKHGFALSFNTGDAPGADVVRVLCDVTHIGGHAKAYKADMPADGKGARGGDVMTKTHAVGSAMSYGMRYLLKMIFNVAVGEDDDDGNAAGDTQERREIKAPDGFAKWLEGMEVAATRGLPILTAGWNEAPRQYTQHLTRHCRDKWLALKRKAEQVKA